MNGRWCGTVHVMKYWIVATICKLQAATAIIILQSWKWIQINEGKWSFIVTLTQWTRCCIVRYLVFRQLSLHGMNCILFVQRQSSTATGCLQSFPFTCYTVHVYWRWPFRGELQSVRSRKVCSCWNRNQFPSPDRWVSYIPRSLSTTDVNSKLYADNLPITLNVPFNIVYNNGLNLRISGGKLCLTKKFTHRRIVSRVD